MTLAQSILVALSLCADSFAVSLCSGVGIRRLKWKKIILVSFAFAVIHTGLLLMGVTFGGIFAGIVQKLSDLLAFLLLLYVGGEMLVEGIKNKPESCNLDSFRNVIMGGVATSIDALAVGVAFAMSGEYGSLSQKLAEFIPLFLSVFVVTIVSVLAGICGGHAVGNRFGRWAEIVGGLVLIGIGARVLF